MRDNTKPNILDKTQNGLDGRIGRRQMDNGLLMQKEIER